MSNVGLLYVGAVLFLNGFMLLGKVDGKSAGIFNLFIGGLQVFTPIYIILTANGDLPTIFSASGLFLFGFTYLYVGITNLTNSVANGVGYYSLWVSILAIGYSIANFTYLGDIKFGVIWLMWSYLWFLFYLLLARNKPIGPYTGWIALIQSWITCTIPGFMLLLDVWNQVTDVIIILLGIGSFLLFTFLYFTGRTFNKTTKLKTTV
ncbi:AmiS/UreI family transporter [Alkalihalobacterium elongatum]|uniref:AmiS/UreI family transporter n=1 Tax=Alkalihalobacterium elongatum TaxID=2675466 RepID=UPI001C1FB80B|nr:AmiS/UreI family transporter [Alkalihalobacterium elongatum]